MLKKKVNAVALLSMSVLLTACFGGSSGGSGGGGSSLNSTFIDAPVYGLTVSIDGVEQKTNESGKFSCPSGKQASFSIGGLPLNSAPVDCGSVVFVDQLGADWEKAAYILQALSVVDPASGKIDVSSFSGDLSGISLSTASVSDINTEIAADIQPHAPVDFNAAKAHAVASKIEAEPLAKFAGKTLTDADSGEQIEFGAADFTGSVYGVPHAWNGGMNCSEKVVFKKNGTLTISAVDLSACIAEDDEYEDNWTTDFKIVNDCLVVDGGYVTYCE